MMVPKIDTVLYSMLGLLNFLMLVGRKLLVFLSKKLVMPQFTGRKLKKYNKLENLKVLNNSTHRSIFSKISWSVYHSLGLTKDIHLKNIKMCLLSERNMFKQLCKKRSNLKAT